MILSAQSSSHRASSAEKCAASEVARWTAASGEAASGKEEPLQERPQTERLRSALCIVPSGKNREALHPLPVQALRLPEPTVQLLGQLGIYTIGQLERLPRASLSSRFGDPLLRRWDQALGRMQEVIVAHRAPPPLEAQWALEHPTAQREAIERGIRHLTEHLAELLVERNQGALQLVCQLDCVDGSPSRIEAGLFRPTATARHLAELIQMQLDQRILSGPVSRVSIRALCTARLEDRQHQLLAGAAQDFSRELARLVDRLSGRLGRDRVVEAQLRSDAQVEWAYHYVPLTGRPRPRSCKAAAKARDGAEPGERPLQLYTPPWPLEVMAVAPKGPPASFVYRGQQHRVARHWGPERIETAWWRGPSVRRDYYRVEDQQGSRFWLFRNLSDGTWMLHGIFE